MAHIDYFLENEQERQTLAQTLQREIIAHHTYVHRARDIMHLLDQHELVRPRQLDKKAFELVQNLFTKYSDQEVPA